MSFMNKELYKTVFLKKNVYWKEERKSRREGGRKGKGGKKEEGSREKRKKGRILFSMIKAMSVERTAFSYSISELLTKTGLKQSENKGRKTNVL